MLFRILDREKYGTRKRGRQKRRWIQNAEKDLNGCHQVVGEVYGQRGVEANCEGGDLIPNKKNILLYDAMTMLRKLFQGRRT